jgi:hypothetical protein
MIPQSMMLSCMGGMVGCIDGVRGFTKPLNENDVMLRQSPPSPVLRQSPPSPVHFQRASHYHLTHGGRAHDCQAKGRRFKSRHRRFFNLQPYLLAVVGFVGLGRNPGEGVKLGSNPSRADENHSPSHSIKSNQSTLAAKRTVKRPSGKQSSPDSFTLVRSTVHYSTVLAQTGQPRFAARAGLWTTICGKMSLFRLHS